MIPILGGLALESLAALAVYRTAASSHGKALRIYGPNVAKTTPVVDQVAKWMAGTPTKTQQRVANILVKNLRRFVATKAFEYAVLACVNSKSKLRNTVDRLKGR